MTSLFQHSLFVTVTALGLLLFKGIFKNKLSAKWQVWLWILLLIRVAIPTLPQSNFSVFNAVPQPPMLAVSPSVPTTQVGPFSTESIPTTDVMPREVESKQTGRYNLWDAIYIAGAVTMFFYFFIVYLSLQLRLKKAIPITDSETLSVLEECQNLLGMKSKITLLSGASTPMLTGIRNPKLILPEISYSPSDLKAVFLHELCHHKHHDILILWLAMLVLCLNWFNPVIWYCFFVLRRDIEVYCDERVLPYVESKKDYATLLLKTALSKNRFILGTTSLQNGKKEVQRRIHYLSCFQKPKLIWVMLLSLLAVILSVLFLTDSVTDYTMSEKQYVSYINRPMGAIMAELDYADETTAVFHYLDGLFVYDIRQDKILHKFDLNKFNCAPHSQGEVVLSVSVSKDGKTILLTSQGQEDIVKKFDNYLIDTQSGKVKQTRQAALSLPIPRRETELLIPHGEGWIADRCIVQGETVYYLSYQKGNVDNIHLNKRTGNVKDEYYPFHARLTSIPGTLFHFWSDETPYFLADYPGYHDIFSEGKALGVAEEVSIPHLDQRSQINNHSEDTVITPIMGYPYSIYQVTETQGNPAASGNSDTHKITMYFLEYPTKKDTYAVLFFETGMFDENEVAMMLKSFTFTPIPQLISNEVQKHLKPNESVMVNSGMAWHIILEEKHLGEIEKLIRLTGYDPNFSVESMDQRRIYDRTKFLDKNLYFYMLYIEKEDGTTYPKLYIFNYDTAELLLSSPYSNERGLDAQRLFIKLNAFTASEVKSALYVVTKQYMETEYINAFSPYYQCISQEISNWRESGNEATFTYHTTDQNWNRDPDKVDYIIKEKEAGNKEKYERLKEAYLKPIEMSLEFKIVYNGTTPTLYHNSAPTGVEWTPVKMTDFVGEMPR
ncbi:MAG: hypothetical protein J6K51_00065 [Clostridia bacterium]|nr:hypothetical protein [Clostridia bacterium]